MAKIRIMGVRRGDNNHTVHVVLAEPLQVGGEERDNPIGEAFVTFDDGTRPAKVKADIIKAARGIMAKHKEAQRIRQRLEQVEFPEIE